LTQELQAQQQELTETNKRLEQQAKSLQASEELLRQQQEELQQTNEELEEKANLLSEQKSEVERKNREIELARRAIEEKAEQLALTSKYKSEFLANMSHELRTPLNSMLVLSELLAENPDKNLTDKQVEFARTIHSSGADLLALINEILDLSKIESGTMAVHVGDVDFAELRADLTRVFDPVAENKGLRFSVEVSPSLPRSMRTDSKRLQQVLKNLLSNAFKFTHKGEVALRVEPASKGLIYDNEALNRAETVVAFSVSDTGIGIPKDKQRIIFEAFQQADGTTSRKYGGTGLGLSISREIARLLGGEIRLASTPNEGSTFTLFVPLSYSPAGAQPQEVGFAGDRAGLASQIGESLIEAEVDPALLEAGDIPDDRDEIHPGDRVLLVVEDDPGFARILLDMAREKGFKGIIASRGDAALALAHKFQPDAITLDIRLPGVHGLAVLDRLKHDPTTRHIPVHIISLIEEAQVGLKMGARVHLKKPVTKEALNEAFANIKGFIERPARKLLVVEDNDVQRNTIVEMIGNGDVQTTAVATGEEALAALKEQEFDCVVIDLGLPGMDGFELIEKIKKETGRREPPIIIYTGKDLSKQEETELRRVAETVIVKDVKSMERLLDETALFLHRVEANLPEPTRQLLEQLHQTDTILDGKKVLIVDDDIRNIFAITSALERHKMDVVYAENGRDAIEMLENTPGIDVVLMDVMMPEMDGYEAMRAIRGLGRFASLPIIALTAKAMKGDREKCIEAGASDYVTKPVDIQQLLSLLRVWLYK
jgi:CheY-like chemotaxis protein/signal transduction histidine kinase